MNNILPPPIFQSPLNDEIEVSPASPILVRYQKELLDCNTTCPFLFIVTGSESGIHNGVAYFSDDSLTMGFKPSLPFTLNEKVTVKFIIPKGEIASTCQFSFRTSHLSETSAMQALQTLSEHEQAEHEHYLQASAATLPMGKDTILHTPAVVVIDTVTTHEDENIFFSPTSSTLSHFSFLGITSDTGTKLLYFKDIPEGTGNFRMQPDGTLTFFRQYSSPSGGVFSGRIDHLDKNLNLIDTFQCKDGATADLHDFQLLPDGHALMVSYDPRYVNMRDTLLASGNPQLVALASTADTNELVYGAIIQELDQNKNLVFQWKSWDHFRIVDAAVDIHFKPANVNDTIIDYMHINAAVIDPKDGNIIASFRHQDEITKINRSTGATIWRWGGKNNQFTFTGPASSDTTAFSHQHDPLRIANGHITLFDNGNLRLKDTTINGKDTIVNHPYSRALEYDLDEVNHKATVVWKNENFPYAAAAGNVQRLANGNTLIGLGITVQPSAIEVTPTGEKVFQMSIQKGAFSYRTYRFPFTPPSGVKTHSNSLSAPSFQLYPNPATSLVSISALSTSSEPTEISLYNLLGREVRRLTVSKNAMVSNKIELNLDGLTSGTYFCRINSHGSTSNLPLIIERK